MYSVIRFTMPKERASELLPIGDRVNAREPGVFTGLRRAGDGFACDLGRMDGWPEHSHATMELVARHGQAISAAVAIGARVTLDVALGAEDRRAGAVALSVASSPQLLRVLGDANVWLELSFY